MRCIYLCCMLFVNGLFFIPFFIFGVQAVGKTSILYQCVYNSFNEIYDPTIEDTFRYFLTLDRTVFDITFIDTYYPEEFSALTDCNIMRSDLCIIAYSITDKPSFDEVINLVARVNNTRKEKTMKPLPIALCGNKCDLESTRQVPFEKGQILSEEIKALFFETSAKSNINVKEMICNLIANFNLSQEKTNFEISEEDEALKKTKNGIYKNKEKKKWVLM
ncbi:GTP-binding protein Di-Ras2, putative [Entamoeba invadens IP1]|uniref:GTP-binding protein Di-Ras2, putative n=1 Tax=Entamoeba invadens IP1 TaxID=370355 RepID=L7FN96_ENTIV|nr:GTP-binding protein Di-Ras2, putative [Entamoeba invadens IP1]ELP93716.1 GTP-binding protein Di-Ras2, putative [Entamoeba invadens IP1]|eukprot:XP_004260487.1 GTP-binding protein Di-Ras2, putative [Entamoeba invadens IP1]